MLASPDQQLSLTDPDSRSMATSGHGSGVVGYNVQVAVDTKHHLTLRMRSRMMAQIERNSQTSLARLRTLSASMNSKPLPIVATSTAMRFWRAIKLAFPRKADKEENMSTCPLCAKTDLCTAKSAAMSVGVG